MIYDASFETDLLAILGHRLELRLGRMAEKDRGIVIVRHAENFFDFGLEFALVVEKIVPVFERVGPRQRIGMGTRVCSLVPSAGLAADDGERIRGRIVRHPQSDDAGLELLRRPGRLDLREKPLGDRAAGPNLHGSETLLRAPRFQRAAHAGDRPCRIFPSHDRLVEYPLHAAFRRQLGDAQRILLTFMRVAVDVDRVLDADHVIERGIDRLFVTAARGIRRYRAN